MAGSGAKEQEGAPPGRAGPSGRAGRRTSLAGLLGAIVFLTGAGTVAGFFGRAFWALENAAAFRTQYLALLLVAAVVYARRSRAAALASLCCAGLNLVVLGPLFWPAPDSGEVAAGGPRLRVLLFNVHTHNDRKADVLEYLLAADADVVACLETDVAWASALAGLHERYPHRIVRPRPDNFGIGLWSRLPVEDLAIRALGEARVPSITGRVLVDGRPVELIVTHPVPPVSARTRRLRDEQLARVAERAAATPGALVVLGDLNAAPWTAVVRDLRSAAALRDTAQGRGPRPTWPAAAPWLGVPLDQVLVSADLTVIAHRVGPAHGSDHRPVIAELALGARGRD